MDMPDKVTVTERDQGQTITVRVGQPVVVSLPENATTGYRWAVERVAPESVEIREGESQYGGGAVGTGGRAQWIFVPKAPGTVSIALKRWRHWEGDKSFVVDGRTIKVKSGKP
jgi:inhibitor of cysteine peptidase